MSRVLNFAGNFTLLLVLLKHQLIYNKYYFVSNISLKIDSEFQILFRIPKYTHVECFIPKIIFRIQLNPLLSISQCFIIAV